MRVVLEASVRTSIEKQLSELRAQLDAKAAELSHKQGELEENTYALTRTRSQIERDAEEAARARKKLESEMQDHTSKKSQFDSEAAAIQAKLTEAEKENTRLQQLVITIELQIKEGKTRESQLAQDLEAANTKIADLEKLLSELKSKHEAELKQLQEASEGT